MDKIGWLTLAEANTYMDERLGSDDFWDTEQEAKNTKALKTAHNRLQMGNWSFPEEETQAMKNAQCEMALFLLQHLSDMDARTGLQAQGVTSAGIVEEQYDKKSATGFPPIIEELLKSLEKGKSAYKIKLDRK